MKWLPAIIWLGFIIYFSLHSIEGLSHPIFSGSDKLYHLFTYAFWQALFFIPVRGKSSANLWTILFLVNVVTGGLMEILQASLHTGRTGEFGDLLFNILGALIVYIFCFGK